MMTQSAWKTAVATACAALALAGCAGVYGGVDGGTANQLSEKQAATVQKQLAGKVAGDPVNCVPMSNLDNVVKVSDSLVLYRVSKSLVYRNDLRGSCMGLARDDIMVVRTFGTSQQCNGDIIHMVDRMTGMMSGSCSFGKFTPYRTPKTS